MKLQAELMVKDHLLEALKPCFPAITEVNFSNKKPYLAYNFNEEPLGFWGVPESEGCELHTRIPNRTGVFEKLNPRTINSG